MSVHCHSRRHRSLTFVALVAAVIAALGSAAAAFGSGADGKPAGARTGSPRRTPARELGPNTPSGALDPAFGSGGTLATGFRPGCTAQAGAVAIDPSGRIVAAGGACGATVHHGFALAATRERDPGPAFGSGGKVRSTFLPATEITGARTLAKVSGAVFRFSAIGPGTGFECALVSRDQPKPEFKSCRTPKSYI
jgi:hypothetical protein